MSIRTLCVCVCVCVFIVCEVDVASSAQRQQGRRQAFVLGAVQKNEV